MESARFAYAIAKCNVANAPIERPTTCALSILSASSTARISSRARACDRDGERAVCVCHTEVQRSERAHRKADDMRLVDLERIEHGADIVPRPRLRIALEILR